MNLREAVGFAFIVLGLCLVPAAWAFSRFLWILAFVLIAVGTALFYTQRMMKKEEEIEREGGVAGLPVVACRQTFTTIRGGRLEGVLKQWIVQMVAREIEPHNQSLQATSKRLAPFVRA